jgi:DNA repair photolyase
VTGGVHGRGTGENPEHRFTRERIEIDRDVVGDADAASQPRTELFRDVTKSILVQNDSPDVGFEWSVNPYRGCEHGCIYCYARPSHEYLGMSAGLDFETRILVKERAPELLRAELMAEKWQPRTIAISGNTDCYQPIERQLRLTRRCLEVLEEFRNPVAIITKNALVERDVDLLRAMAARECAMVGVTLTTLDEDLASRLEPRASTPRRRLAAMKALSAAGVPVHVMCSPVIPGLTDHELPALLRAARDHGATSAGYVFLRLPHGVAELFDEWLAREEPLKREKILRRVEDARGGKRNDSRFGSRMRGEGKVADEIADLFRFAAARAGFESRPPILSTAHFRRPGPRQGRLF